MKCPNCKKEIANDSKFCEHCGAQIKKNMKPLLITICVIIVLTILGVFLNRYVNNMQQERALLERQLRASQIAQQQAQQQAQQAQQQAQYAKTHGNISGHEWVDLGLPSGLKWATCNVGAYSPEEYGYYYAWGEVSSKSKYNSDNSRTHGKTIYSFKGESDYDVATYRWGGGWRMPSKSEMEELVNKCTWTWTTQGGKNGYKVTGPNGNSIFLPAAGRYEGYSTEYRGKQGYYWTDSPDMDYKSYANSLQFGGDYIQVGDYTTRYLGFTVRPVLK